jgi:hypothetical protein
MPAAGYAYAIYQRIIEQSLKRRIYVNAQDNKFVQCVSPNIVDISVNRDSNGHYSRDCL